MSKYTKTILASDVDGAPVVVIDQTVGEITQYGLLDDQGLLHLTSDGRPVMVRLERVVSLTGVTEQEAGSYR